MEEKNKVEELTENVKVFLDDPTNNDKVVSILESSDPAIKCASELVRAFKNPSEDNLEIRESFYHTMKRVCDFLMKAFKAACEVLRNAIENLCKNKHFKLLLDTLRGKSNKETYRDFIRYKSKKNNKVEKPKVLYTDKRQFIMRNIVRYRY